MSYLLQRPAQPGFSRFTIAAAGFQPVAAGAYLLLPVPNWDKIMNDKDAVGLSGILLRIRSQAFANNIRVTQHAQQEMVEEEITLDQVLRAVASGQIVEDYPEHLRGACCLIGGVSDDGRPLHVVCTSAQPTLINITVYEPLPPKWISPTQRRMRP